MNCSQSPMIHVIDDDADVRDSIAFLLASESIDAETYESAEDFLSSSECIESGCLVLDIRMPGLSGLELQSELKKRGQTFVIVFITGHGDIEMAVRAMRNGAFDFIEKPFRDQQLLDSVRSARELATQQQLSDQHLSDVKTRFKTLSPREKQVMRLVTDGKANKVIAHELGVSQRTVELHRAHAMEKMAVRNLAQLMRAALALESLHPS